MRVGIPLLEQRTGGLGRPFRAESVPAWVYWIPRVFCSTSRRGGAPN